MQRAISPLEELLAFEQGAENTPIDLLDECIKKRKSILDEMAKRGLLWRCFVDVFCELEAARLVRDDHRTPNRSFIREIHHTLASVPGIPPEPSPSIIQNVDDEIAHLDSLCRSLDAILLHQINIDQGDGEFTLQQLATLTGISKSTLEKQRNKPTPREAGSGRRSAKYSYQEFCRWLSTTNLRYTALPENFREANEILCKMSGTQH